MDSSSSKIVELEEENVHLKKTLIQSARSNSSDVERSPRSQSYAMIRKHLNGYRRNTDFVRQEVFNLVLYSALLIGFSFTSVETTHDPVFDSSTTLTTDDILLDGPCQSDSGFKGPPCYIAFGDTEFGCSAELEEAISSMKICERGMNESFVNETFRNHDIVLPSCTCQPVGSFDSRDDNIQNRVAFAVEFATPFKVLQENEYTIRTPKPRISKVENVSPFMDPQPSVTDEFIYNGLTSIQTAVDGAVLNRTINVGIANFPRIGYTQWIPGALMNVPLYLTIAVMYSVAGITTQIAEEQTKKLSHGLFMQGLSPIVYWSSWFFVLFIRTLATILVMFLITVTMLIEHMSPSLFFLGFLGFGLFACNASVFVGLLGVKAKTASNLVLLLPAIVSALTYSYTAVLNSNSAESPFPDWLTLLLSLLAPPFSFSMYCTNLLLLNNEEDGGMTFDNIYDKTRAGISPMNSLLGIYAGTILLFTVNLYKMIKNTGIIFKCFDRKVNSGTSNSREAVKIQNLHKHYNLGGGRTTRAVNGLSCSFYSNAINVFLGSNGSGKSTTISVLTGLYRPTSGDALIGGLSVKSHMNQLRSKIGVCAQDNILWDLLTVREHLQVFSAIRNVKEGKAEEEHIESLLRDVGLYGSIDVLSKNLSGGQKRKLMIAISFIGDPQVIFLDEPTAGVDAFSRREIWRLLSRKKSNGRCIILCTHHMMEAEVLADNIVVIHQGELLESGSTSELKEKYGKNLHMHVGIKAGRLTARDVLDKIGCKELRLESTSLMDRQIEEDTVLKLLLPSDTADVANVLTKVEDLIHSNVLDNMGLQAVTLEDVFCNLDKKARGEKDQDSVSELPTLQFKRDEYSKFRRFVALVTRRATSFWRSSVPVPYMEVCIAFAIVLGVWTTNLNFGSNDVTPITLNLDSSTALTNQHFQIPYEVISSSSASSGAILHHLEQQSDPRLVESTGPCLGAFILHVEDTNACWSGNGTAPEVDTNGMSLDGNFVGAYRFGESADIEYTVLPNKSSVLSLPTLMSLSNNALGQNLTQNANLLKCSFKPMPEAIKSQEDKDQTELIYAQIRSVMIVMLMMAFSYLFATRARNSVENRVHSHYQLQCLQGVSFSEYWLSQILWDAIYSYIITIPAMIWIFVFDTPLSSGTTVLLFFMWPLAILPFVYVFAYFFTEPEACFNTFSGVFTLSFFVIYLGYFAVSLPPVADATGIGSGGLAAIRYVGMLFPHTCFAFSLRGVILSDKYGYNPLLPSPGNVETLAYFDLPVETAFAPVMFLIVDMFLFSYILIWLESGRGTKSEGFFANLSRCFSQCSRCACCACCYSARTGNLDADEEDRLSEEFEDDDVRRERRACEIEYESCDSEEKEEEKEEEYESKSSLLEKGSTKSTLHSVVFRGVRKQYPPAGSSQRYISDGTVAVRDVSLRIRKGEVFGLLGENGAGKSTLLNILMRQLSPSRGHVLVNEKDIQRMMFDKNDVGFCSQANALFDNLSVRETLRFYARVRGVHNSEIEDFVTSWIESARLERFEHTKSNQLSGGNKRKLSLTISMLGLPSLAILDEPSAGVDPASRVRLHRLIKAARNLGTTTVLTTHQMTDAETMSDRISIMVKGRLRCLGTPHHLLTKYSKEIVCSIKMRRNQSLDEDVIPMLKSLVPSARVITKPSSQYAVLTLSTTDDRTFRMSKVYKELERYRDEKQKIEFFSIGLRSLESVFVSLSSENSETNGKIHDDSSNVGAELYQNSKSRVVLEGVDKNTCGCLFGRSGGIGEDMEWFEHVPDELADRGISNDVWLEWMKKLTLVQEQASSCFLGRILNMFCFILGMLGASPCFVFYGCFPWSRCDPFQNALRKWMDDFNAQVLNPKDIHVKGFTFGRRKRGGVSSNSDQDQLSALVFALNRHEAARLKREPVLQLPMKSADEKDKNYLCWSCTSHRDRVL